jgi:copper chaperone
MNETFTYQVPGMSYRHCKDTISGQLWALASVSEVDVGLAARRFVIRRDGLNDAALRAAIDEAAYEVW